MIAEFLRRRKQKKELRDRILKLEAQVIGWSRALPTIPAAYRDDARKDIARKKGELDGVRHQLRQL